MYIPQQYSLEWTGNGAAKNFAIGFKPRFAVILNITDGTTVDFYINADGGTTPAGSIDVDATAGPVSDSGGITPYAGDTSNAPGLSIDAGNNPNGKVMRIFAIG